MVHTVPRSNEAQQHVNRAIESLDEIVRVLQPYVDSENMPAGSQYRLNGVSVLARSFQKSLEKAPPNDDQSDGDQDHNNESEPSPVEA